MFNRQLSGMNYRTNTLSLNQPTPTPIPSTSTLPTQDTSAPTPTTASEEASPIPLKRKLKLSKDSSTSKRSKPSTTSSSKDEYAPPSTRLSDLGGVDQCIESMLELVALPLSHPEVYLHTGVRPPRGVLLVGPPGCGKTMLAGAIAGVSQPH